MDKIFKITDWVLRINKKLGGRVISMLSIALALSLVAVTFTDTWISSVKTQGDKIVAIKLNTIALRELKTSLFEAESAQRGYILTQKELYLAPLNKAIEEARARIRSINRLVLKTGTPVPEEQEKAWVLELSSSVEAKISEMQLTTLLAKQGQVKEAMQVITTNKGMVDSFKIIKMIDGMSEAQDAIANTVKINRDNTLLWARMAIYGSALVLMLLVILVIKQLLAEMAARDKLRERLDVELKNYEVELETRTRQLKTLALDAQSDVERERHKLARELHDELGSILTATKMDISWAIRKSKELTPEVSEKLSRTIHYMDQGIQFQREVIQHLRPSMIETFGFWPALRSLIDDVAVRNQWEMDLILPEDSTEISETVSLIVYRVVQEVLNNATKYAQATKVSLYLIMDLGFLKLELEDNGVGMDMHMLVDGATHGLRGMKNRVMGIGGNFQMISEPGKGVATIVMIPLNIAQDNRDTNRDQERHEARDHARDGSRDETRDDHRDDARDARRDAARDAIRDEAHDSKNES